MTSNAETLTAKLTNIGDAIRTKTGTTSSLLLDDMPTAISNISGGGSSSDTLLEMFDELANATSQANAYIFNLNYPNRTTWPVSFSYNTYYRKYTAVNTFNFSSLTGDIPAESFCAAGSHQLLLLGIQGYRNINLPLVTSIDTRAFSNWGSSVENYFVTEENWGVSASTTPATSFPSISPDYSQLIINKNYYLKNRTKIEDTYPDVTGNSIVDDWKNMEGIFDKKYTIFSWDLPNVTRLSQYPWGTTYKYYRYINVPNLNSLSNSDIFDGMILPYDTGLYLPNVTSTTTTDWVRPFGSIAIRAIYTTDKLQKLGYSSRSFGWLNVGTEHEAWIIDNSQEGTFTVPVLGYMTNVEIGATNDIFMSKAYFYVPKAYLSEFENATNWSVYYAAGRIRAIEDYETELKGIFPAMDEKYGWTEE